MAAQPSIAELLPRKPLLLGLLFLAGLLAIAGLETLYHFMPRLAAQATDGRIAAFDLDSEGSLAAWFSSLLLLGASLLSLQIWSLRRHRLDDYHGRYRIWFWAALVWFVMSVDEACSLHEGFKELMAHATGRRLFGDGSLWWIMAYGLVLGVLGIRLLVEVRSCRTSTTFFVLAGLSWLSAIFWQLDLIVPASGARSVMVEEGCEMLGNLFLLTALAVHARHVLLDIEGLLPTSGKRRKKKAKAEPAAAEASASSASKRDDLSASRTTATSPAASGSAKPAAGGASSVDKRTSTTPSKPASSESTRRVDAAEDPLAKNRLSRADRRAQRRANRDRDE